MNRLQAAIPTTLYCPVCGKQGLVEEIWSNAPNSYRCKNEICKNIFELRAV